MGFFILGGSAFLNSDPCLSCTLTGATLSWASDDAGEIFINGNLANSCGNGCWSGQNNLSIPISWINTTGDNVLAAYGWAMDTIFSAATWQLTLTYSDCSATYVQTGDPCVLSQYLYDSNYSAAPPSSGAFPTGWNTPSFNDSGWSAPATTGPFDPICVCDAIPAPGGGAVPWTWGNANWMNVALGDGYMYREHFQAGVSACSTQPPTFTPTSSATLTMTPTPTFTFTPTFTPTETYTRTATFSPTPTSTFTFTRTPTQTYTRTDTATSTFTFTQTFTPTETYTRTATASPTMTPTHTFTSTPCGYPGETCTPTPTPLSADIFYVSKNIFSPSDPVSIFVDYTQFPGNYELMIYNSAGEHIKTLDSRSLQAPVSQWYQWDGTNKYDETCASGIYIFYLVEPYGTKLKKVILSK